VAPRRQIPARGRRVSRWCHGTLLGTGQPKSLGAVVPAHRRFARALTRAPVAVHGDRRAVFAGWPFRLVHVGRFRRVRGVRRACFKGRDGPRVREGRHHGQMEPRRPRALLPGSGWPANRIARAHSTITGVRHTGPAIHGIVHQTAKRSGGVRRLSGWPTVRRRGSQSAARNCGRRARARGRPTNEVKDRGGRRCEELK